MKVTGIITEYNPFHNGHKYHIEEAKRVTGADYVIAVMSGNFVQRGTPAMIDKYNRTRMALNNGADIVFELPVCYATGSAEYFALGAVSLLDRLGVVDYLCFGSECGDIALIKDAAELLVKASAPLEENLTVLMKEGLTYPAARARAVKEYLACTGQAEKYGNITRLLEEPNNILGIEYVKALYECSSSITPVTIKRQSSHYHDTELADTEGKIIPVNKYYPLPSRADDVPDDPLFSSATAIRETILESECIFGLSAVKRSVPDDVYAFLIDHYYKTFPITEEDFSRILKYKLLSEDKNSLEQYLDISPDLADRMLNIPDLDKNISALLKSLKTRNVTQTRINRAMIHLLLNMKEETINGYKENGYTFYARLLGIRRESTRLLRKITDMEGIPVITKVAKANEQLDTLGLQMLSEDIFAAHIYNQAIFEKFGTSIPNEYKHGICIV